MPNLTKYLEHQIKGVREKQIPLLLTEDLALELPYPLPYENLSNFASVLRIFPTTSVRAAVSTSNLGI